jgi:hypothetical protein
MELTSNFNDEGKDLLRIFIERHTNFIGEETEEDMAARMHPDRSVENKLLHKLIGTLERVESFSVSLQGPHLTMTSVLANRLNVMTPRPSTWLWVLSCMAYDLLFSMT